MFGPTMSNRIVSNVNGLPYYKLMVLFGGKPISIKWFFILNDYLFFSLVDNIIVLIFECFQTKLILSYGFMFSSQTMLNVHAFFIYFFQFYHYS